MIKKLVSKLVRKHKTNCPFEIAKSMNIDVWYLELPENVRGFFTRILRRNYIALNIQYPYEWQRFTCAHELGHYFYDRGIGYYFNDHQTDMIPGKFECRANQFAITLLTSGDPIKGGENIQDYFKRHHIPLEMIQYLDNGGE